jgi:alkanesulfonate monooxygenase SsuD/methylene tetrahydromethanopterin reductase-like flavin-dependent oxidoreductase (luciferase family)
MDACGVLRRRLATFLSEGIHAEAGEHQAVDEPLQVGRSIGGSILYVEMFVARYDLRCPPIASTSRDELYATALAQASYCDTHGFDALVLSEHHGVDDGYLPSPLVVAAAFAACTSRVRINVAALLVPLHDPLRLAEDIAVLDHLSRGRVGYVFGLGYRPEEYTMFDRPWKGRGERMEEAVETLLEAWTGESFEYQGRTVRVTPAPYSRPRPMAFYGGVSPAAASRAARLGLDFFPQVNDPDLAERYRAECRASGREPGLVMLPNPGPGTIFCAKDPDSFWERYGQHLLHEARVYDSWQGDHTSAVRDSSTTVEEMRKAGIYVVWTPDELIDRCREREVRGVTTHPLCGGLPPEPAWENLRLLAEVVMPALRS